MCKTRVLHAVPQPGAHHIFWWSLCSRTQHRRTWAAPSYFAFESCQALKSVELCIISLQIKTKCDQRPDCESSKVAKCCPLVNCIRRSWRSSTGRIYRQGTAKYQDMHWEAAPQSGAPWRKSLRAAHLWDLRRPSTRARPLATRLCADRRAPCGRHQRRAASHPSIAL